MLIDWWQVLKKLEGHTSYLHSVAISTDGAKIVSGSADKSVRVWSMETGQVPACCRGVACEHCCGVSIRTSHLADRLARRS